MTSVRVIVALHTLALVTACAPAEVSETLALHTSGETPQALSKAADILSQRVRAFLPSYRSTVSPSVDGSVIRLIFRGTAPPDEQIRYLITTRGELRIGPADDRSSVWVSDFDVEDAALVTTNNAPFLAVRLRERAARMLAQATSSNVGRKLLVTWDGRPILVAPIRSALGAAFEFNVPSIEEGRMMRAILKGGRLPVSVESVEYLRGT